MFNVGFSELVLTTLVALAAIGPKELPTVVRSLAKAMGELRGFSKSLRGQVDTLAREAGLHELASTTTIIDLEGKTQPAYDVAELTTLAAKKPIPAPDTPEGPAHD